MHCFNRIILLVFTISLLPFSRSVADDAHSKLVSVSSKARVITPIALENTDNQGLNFGRIAIGTTLSKIKVAPALSVPINVVSGDATVITSVTQKAAKFTVSGESGKTYTITLPTTELLTYGSAQITVSNFTCSNGTGGTIGTNNLFYVGAELTVPATAIPGSYQGTFNITVAYN